MDDIETTKIISERMSLLPAEVRELIEFKTVDVILSEINTEYSLSKLQTKLLENEILLVLLFLLPAHGFEDRLKESLEIDEFKAKSISEYIQSELFFLVSEYLEVADTYFDSDKPTFNAATKNVSNLESTKITSNVLTDGNNNGSLDEVTPLRTMDMDAKKIHGYGAFYGEENEEDGADATYKSSQDSVLPEKKPANSNQPSTDTSE